MPTNIPERSLRFEPIVHVDEALWRQRVLDQIGTTAPLSARLTLLSAPAGFGKTTVLAQMVNMAQQAGHLVAWLNCDERDKHPTVFAGSLGSALARCDLGPSTTGELGADLMQERLCSLAMPLLLCIDDYEKASGAEVDGILEQLARVVSPKVSIVVASREAPHHHLTRLQLAGVVRIVDADLLRFNLHEARALLGDVLPERAAEQMAAYAGGWPFALQLARLRASGSGAPPAGLGAESKWLTIPRRQIFEYLANEVLATLSAPLLEFLGDVAVLERVDVGAADALRGHNDSLGFIRELSRMRPVVVVDEDTWSARLHPLLRDYLIDALNVSRPGRTATLHLRAADYLAHQACVHEAVAHAVAGGRLDVAADIIEQAGAFRLFAVMGEVRVRLLIQQLPDATLRSRPRLHLVLLMRNALEGGPSSTLQEFERLEQRIRDADTGPDDPARVDLEFVRCTMLMEASAYRLRFSPWSVLDQSIQRARALPGGDERVLACTIPIEIWFLHQYGPIDRCNRRIREMETLFQHDAYTHNSPWIHLYHARSALANADLAVAERYIRQSLHEDPNFLNFRQDSLSHLVQTLLGQITYQRGELEVAREHFSGAPTARFRLLEILQGSNVDLALCEFALGHVEQAMAQLRRARQLAFEETLPQLDALAGAVELELLARLGEAGQAQSMAERIKLDALWEIAREPFALPWVLVQAFARARFFNLLLQGDANGAADTADCLEQLAKRTGQRPGELCVCLMRALGACRRGPGAGAQADAALSQALAIGAASGMVQAFIDFGPELIALLRDWTEARQAAGADEFTATATRVLQAWEQQFRQRNHGAIANLLTPRELDVLGELAKEHSNKVIAKNLIISPETVKHHLKSIFSKLGVQSREEAISAARKNALLA